MKAFLVIAMFGIAYGFCFEAAAEQKIVAPADSQASSADDSYLAGEARWRLAALPDEEFKVKEMFGPIDKSRQFELNVPWGDDEDRDSPAERMISLWFETAHGTFAMELLDPDQNSESRRSLPPTSRRSSTSNPISS